MDILPLVLVGGAAYYLLVLHPEILQGLGGSGGGAAAAAPSASCQGKLPDGSACPCPAAGVAYAYASKKKKAPAKKAAAGGGKAATPAATTTPAATGTCDCSACSGGTAAAAPAATGGGTWGQNPASKIQCDIPGQACPTIGALGGTSQWCKCIAGAGGATAAKTTAAKTTTTKGKTTTTATGGVGTVESFAGVSMANEGWGFSSLQSYIQRDW